MGYDKDKDSEIPKVRVPSDTRESLDQISAATGWSISDLIRLAIDILIFIFRLKK